MIYSAGSTGPHSIHLAMGNYEITEVQTLRGRGLELQVSKHREKWLVKVIEERCAHGGLLGNICSEGVSLVTEERLGRIRDELRPVKIGESVRSFGEMCEVIGSHDGKLWLFRDGKYSTCVSEECT